jgi:hypothetical protein
MYRLEISSRTNTDKTLLRRNPQTKNYPMIRDAAETVRTKMNILLKRKFKK